MLGKLLKNKEMIILVTLILSLVSCTSGGINKQVKIGYQERLNNCKLTEVVIDTTAVKEIFIDATLTNVDVHSSALAADAGMRSAAYTPGYNPAAGLVGTLIGLQVAKGIRRNSQKEELIKPIKPFIHAYQTASDDIFNKTNIASHFTTDQLPFKAVDSCRDFTCDSTLRIEPAISLTENYRSLIISFNVALATDNGETIYQNTLHYYSPPIIESEIDKINASWIANDYAKIRLAVQSAGNALVKLFLWDLENLDKKVLPNDSKPIRISNRAGLFYDRGIEILRDENRIAYMTLEGNIKSVPFERILTTAEYYEYLSTLNATTDKPDQVETNSLEKPDEHAQNLEQL